MARVFSALCVSAHSLFQVLPLCLSDSLSFFLSLLLLLPLAPSPRTSFSLSFCLSPACLLALFLFLARFLKVTLTQVMPVGCLIVGNRYGPGVFSKAGQGARTHEMDRQCSTSPCPALENRGRRILTVTTSVAKPPPPLSSYTHKWVRHGASGLAFLPTRCNERGR